MINKQIEGENKMFNKYMKIGVSNYYFYNEEDELICLIDALCKDSITYTPTGVITLKLTNIKTHRDIIENLEENKITKIISKFRAYDFETCKEVMVNEVFIYFKIDNIEVASEKGNCASEMIISININGKSEVYEDSI